MYISPSPPPSLHLSVTLSLACLAILLLSSVLCCAQVTEGQASQLQLLLGLVARDDTSFAVSLQLPLQLMQLARPANFHGFTSFSRWQNTTRAVLQHGFSKAAMNDGVEMGVINRHMVHSPLLAKGFRLLSCQLLSCARRKVGRYLGLDMAVR
jgi:hypothetical protein